MMPRFLWPVYGFTADSHCETVAVFFNRSDAELFAMHPARDGFEQRHLYCATPRYDRREGGYHVGAA